jgi:hypothetical protein
MKTCGIEIDNDKAVIVSLEKYDDGTIEICEHSTKLSLAEHENSTAVKEYVDILHSQLDTIGADSICIIKRQMKGQFAAGGLSFKIEALIQCYKDVEVELIPLPTIKTFLKKNPMPIKAKYKYQENALKAAFYLISK